MINTELIATKPDVIIEHSTELPEPCWAVCLAEDREYWLWSFSTKRLALSFCKSRGLKVLEVID